MNYPKGDEERVTSACRPGIYAIGGGEGERSRVDRSRAPSLFPRNFAPPTPRNAECAKNWRKTRARGKRSRKMARIFNSDSSPTRERERENEFEEARV